MRELCRLQTFPDDVQVLGAQTVAHKQLGNAVPSLLAEVMAREICRQLLKQRVSGAPRLAVAPAPVASPPARVKPIPAHHLALRGVYAAHPGTGLGPAAQRRRNAA